MMNPNFVSRWNNNNDTLPAQASSSFAISPSHQQQRQQGQSSSSARPMTTSSKNPTNKYILQQDQPMASTAVFGSLRNIPGEPRYLGGDSVLAPMRSLPRTTESAATATTMRNFRENNEDDDHDEDRQEALDDQYRQQQRQRQHQESRQTISSSLPPVPNFPPPPNHSAVILNPNQNVTNSSTLHRNVGGHNFLSQFLPHRESDTNEDDGVRNVFGSRSNDGGGREGRGMINNSSAAKPAASPSFSGVDLEPPPTDSQSKLEKLRAARGGTGQPPLQQQQQQLDVQLDELDLLMYTISKHRHGIDDGVDTDSDFAGHDTAEGKTNIRSSTLHPPPVLSDKDAALFHKLMQRKVLWVRRAQASLFDWATKLQAYEQALHEREARLADTETQRANAYQERVLALTEAETMLRKNIERQTRKERRSSAVEQQLAQQQQQRDSGFDFTQKTKPAFAVGGNDFSFGERLRVARKYLENPDAGNRNGRNPDVTGGDGAFASSTEYFQRPTSDTDASVIVAVVTSDSDDEFRSDEKSYSQISPGSQFSAGLLPKPREMIPNRRMTTGGNNPQQQQLQATKSALRAPSFASIDEPVGGARGGAKKTAFVVS